MFQTKKGGSGMNKDDLEKYGVYELIAESIKKHPHHSRLINNSETLSNSNIRDRKEEKTEFRKRINKEIREGGFRK
jgi:hypothetical protein